MKLSIVIVSYNELDYLEESIKSCMNSNCDYEIIIGDDGSTDGSIELIAKYSKRYPGKIKFFVMDRVGIKSVKDIIPSIRVSNVLKRAFDICQGEYITIISGDDVNTLPNRYIKQVEFLDKNLKYSSCYIDYKKFWNDGTEEILRLRASINEKIFWSIQYVHISCFVFRRECLKNLLPRFCDDTGLIYSILATGKSKHLKMDGFGYRQRNKSIMHEADKVELSLLEIALFQDCLNHGSMKLSSLSRFYKPMQYLMNNRNAIMSGKYDKYLNETSKSANDVLKLIVNDDRLAHKYVNKGCAYYLMFKFLRKANILLNMLRAK